MLIIPILGPSLTQNDLPGPLRNFFSISIEDQDSENKLNGAINQLANRLNVQQRVTKRRTDTLGEFSQHLRAWKPQLPDPNISQQKQIEELKVQLQESEQKLTKKESIIAQLEEQLKYARLSTLLSVKDWKEADIETTKLMFREAKVEDRNYLLREDIEKFPCSSLQKINQLWMNYSDKRFGFSVQKRIWNEVCGQSEELKNYETYQKFGRRVGWIAEENSEWREWEKLTFNIENATEGHLPGLSVLFPSHLFFVVGFYITDRSFSAFMKKLTECLDI
jgi:hypothetical protein